jgi:hypothetical protein
VPNPPRGRKDHYVPQGYLRGFIDPARAKNDRPLWCLNKWRNQWERKAPKQICHAVGMYDFSNDAIEAEHADVTFKKMEDQFPSVLGSIKATDFAEWKEHFDFLLTYMQMIRVRSPQFFVEQGQELAAATGATITSVDHTENKLTYDNVRRLSEAEVHDFTLAKMREEFKKGATWMAEFHWQIRTTFDPQNPVTTSEAPLFVKGVKANPERAMTMEILTDTGSEVWFPLCWQAALVGRTQPFDSDRVSFGREDLNELRHITAEMAPQYLISPQIVDDVILDGRHPPRLESRSQVS